MTWLEARQHSVLGVFQSSLQNMERRPGQTFRRFPCVFLILGIPIYFGALTWWLQVGRPESRN